MEWIWLIRRDYISHDTMKQMITNQRYQNLFARLISHIVWHSQSNDAWDDRYHHFNEQINEVSSAELNIYEMSIFAKKYDIIPSVRLKITSIVPYLITCVMCLYLISICSSLLECLAVFPVVHSIHWNIFQETVINLNATPNSFSTLFNNTVVFISSVKIAYSFYAKRRLTKFSKWLAVCILAFRS